jgi:hypothetical protein
MSKIDSHINVPWIQTYRSFTTIHNSLFLDQDSMFHTITAASYLIALDLSLTISLAFNAI